MDGHGVFITRNPSWLGADRITRFVQHIHLNTREMACLPIPALRASEGNGCYHDAYPFLFATRYR
jgi:hypothetical protein